MVYADEFLKKNFSAGTMKEAFLLASKWVATHVLANELHNVMVRYEKVKDTSSAATVTVHLLASLSEDELRERNCTICKEFHKSFFISESCDCEWCKASAYQRRADEMIKSKKEHCRQKIKSSELSFGSPAQED